MTVLGLLKFCWSEKDCCILEHENAVLLNSHPLRKPFPRLFHCAMETLRHFKAVKCRDILYKSPKRSCGAAGGLEWRAAEMMTKHSLVRHLTFARYLIFPPFILVAVGIHQISLLAAAPVVEGCFKRDLGKTLQLDMPEVVCNIAFVKSCRQDVSEYFLGRLPFIDFMKLEMGLNTL